MEERFDELLYLIIALAALWFGFHRGFEFAKVIGLTFLGGWFLIASIELFDTLKENEKRRCLIGFWIPFFGTLWVHELYLAWMDVINV